MKFLAIAVLTFVPCLADAQTWKAESCKSALLTAYTAMELLPQAEGNSHLTLGDYNADNAPDVAMLLRPKSNNWKQSIGVCLSNVSIPVLINYAYVPGNVFTKPKGTPYYDYDLETTGVYERDVISVSDNECCGASYVLRSGVFVEIVDSD